MPRFSIITVCYNEVDHIRETLDSVVNQTCHNFEFIVVDGGSTDGTREIIEQYANQITWWCSEPDKGIYNAMNKGVKHATGEYVIFMNGGDCFHSENVLQDILATGSNADIIEGYCLKKGTNEYLRKNEQDVARRILTDTLSHQSSFIRRQLLLAYPYDEHYKIVSDWKFWIEAILCHNCSFQFVEIVVSDMDMNGRTFGSYELNLKERKLALADFRNDAKIGSLINVFSDYNELMHDPIVNYACYLSENSKFGYNLVRKIAKRVVKVCKKKN